MKKHIIRSFAFLLVFACTLCTAQAATEASILLKRYNVQLAASGKTITAYFEVSGVLVMDEIGATEVVIERYNGSSWVPVKTFRSSNVKEMTANNVKNYNSSVSYDAVVTGTYHAVITVFATLNGESDSQTITTNTVVVSKISTP